MKVMKRVALAKARGGASLFVASLVGAVVFPASVASAAVWTPQSYVQDGLVTHFDGIDNAKTGTHDSSTNVWKDLVGGASLTLTPGAFWGGAYLNCGTNMQTIVNATSVNTFSATVEAAVNVDNIGRGGSSTTVWPFLVTSLGLAFHGAGDSSHTFRFFVNGADPRPDAANIYDNTLSGTSDGTRYRIYRDGLFAASVNAAGSAGATAAPGISAMPMAVPSMHGSTRSVSTTVRSPRRRCSRTLGWTVSVSTPGILRGPALLSTGARLPGLTRSIRRPPPFRPPPPTPTPGWSTRP